MGLIPEENECKCPRCGKYFLRREYSQKYCDSVACRKGYGKKNTERKSSASPERKAICEYCKKEFTSTERKSAQKYCSDDCCDKASYANSSRGRYFIFERDNFKCIYCGKTSVEDDAKLHVDHIYPKSLGGEDKAYNLITACEECNLSKLNNIPKIYKKLLAIVRKRNKRSGIVPNVTIKLSGDTSW